MNYLIIQIHEPVFHGSKNELVPSSFLYFSNMLLRAFAYPISNPYQFIIFLRVYISIEGTVLRILLFPHCYFNTVLLPIHSTPATVDFTPSLFSKTRGQTCCLNGLFNEECANRNRRVVVVVVSLTLS